MKREYKVESVGSREINLRMNYDESSIWFYSILRMDSLT